ncbi:hypothetical protein KGF57_000941 [Candida theae]|uniref:Uncharacterized protein n=1 Tax=Candida theae TaxID=1198502 RepID=A0AAD5G0B0_9ASCO|nr:uncharacterized protein KGF57_000941 [Candida theae]KAI5964449.1 hypothetical protein KGF57_000941 [Candida theae]
MAKQREFPSKGGSKSTEFRSTDPLSELPDIKTIANVKHRYDIPVIIFHNHPRSDTVLFSDLSQIKQRTRVKENKTVFVTGLPECKLDTKVFRKDELFTAKMHRNFPQYMSIFDNTVKLESLDFAIARCNMDVYKFNNKCYDGYGNYFRVVYKKNLFDVMNDLEREFINFLDRLKKCVSSEFYRKLDLKFGFTEFVMTHGILDEDIDNISQNPNFLESQPPLDGDTDDDDDDDDDIAADLSDGLDSLEDVRVAVEVARNLSAGVNSVIGGNSERGAVLTQTYAARSTGDGAVTNSMNDGDNARTGTGASIGTPTLIANTMDSSFTAKPPSDSIRKVSVAGGIVVESQIPESDDEYSQDEDIDLNFETAPTGDSQMHQVSLSQDIEADRVQNGGAHNAPMPINRQLQPHNSVKVRHFATIADLSKACTSNMPDDSRTIYVIDAVRCFTMVPNAPLVISPSSKEAMGFASFKLYLSDASGENTLQTEFSHQELCRFLDISLSSETPIDAITLQRVKQQFTKLIKQSGTKRVKLKRKTKALNRGLKVKTWCIESSLAELIQ